MASKVTVRFYKVTENAAQASLADCLDAVFAIPDAHDRTRHIDWANFRVECGGLERNFYYGDFYRLQEDDFPPKVGRRAAATPLGLGPDTALGHRVAFGYDKVKRVLGIEKRAAAPSASQLIAYLSEFCGTNAIAAYPIVRPDDIGKLNGVTPRKFNLRIAEPSELEAVDGDQRSFKESLEALKRVVGAPYITLSVGMGSRKGEVPKRGLTSLTSWLMRNYANEKGKIQDLSVDAREPNNRECVLDLLNAHLGDKTELDLPSDDLVLNYGRRKAFVESLFRRFRQEF
ncbi:hypothetical protein [Azospirillum melinis]